MDGSKHILDVLCAFLSLFDAKKSIEVAWNASRGLTTLLTYDTLYSKNEAF